MEKQSSNSKSTELSDIHQRFVNFLASGEKGDLSEDEVDTAMRELANSSELNQKYGELLDDLLHSKDGIELIRRGVKKYMTGRKHEISTRDDVLMFVEEGNFVETDYPEVYDVSLEQTRSRMVPVMREIIGKPGFYNDFINAIPHGSIDFENLSEEALRPGIEKMAGVLAYGYSLKEMPKIIIETTDEGDESGVYCNNAGQQSSIEKTVRIVVDSHSSISEIAITLSHELWHCKQGEIAESDDDSEIAQKYRINKWKYVKYEPELRNYANYKSQLIEQESYYIGAQMGAMIRYNYLVNHPAEMQRLAEDYGRIEAGELKPGQMKDGLDAAYYRDARGMFGQNRRNADEER